jgi:hypothetical protein
MSGVAGQILDKSGENDIAFGVRQVRIASETVLMQVFSGEKNCKHGAGVALWSGKSWSIRFSVNALGVALYYCGWNCREKCPKYPA